MDLSRRFRLARQALLTGRNHKHFKSTTAFDQIFQYPTSVTEQLPQIPTPEPNQLLWYILPHTTGKFKRNRKQQTRYASAARSPGALDFPWGTGAPLIEPSFYQPETKNLRPDESNCEHSVADWRQN